MLELSVHGAGKSVLDRRSFVRATLWAGGALSLPSIWRARAAAASSKSSRDTAVIQIWLGGGPSHVDMYDMKPTLAQEYRGPYKPIATNQPGIQISELMPRQTRLMDRLSIVRS